MSTSVKVYFGIFVDIRDCIDDPYEGEQSKYIDRDSVGEISIIYDGMNNDYCYFGIPLAIVEDVYSFEKTEVNIDNFQSICESIEENLRDCNIIIENKPKLILFTHCE